VNTMKAIQEIERMYSHARSLRAAGLAWMQEGTHPNRSGNVGEDCRILGWDNPDQLIRAADSIEREAAMTRVCLGV